MKTRIFVILCILPALAMLPLLAGCSSTSQAVTYYGLSSPAAPKPPEPAAAGAPPTVGIGSVVLPDYLDRPQLVTRVGPNQLRVDEFHRWAGPLGSEIERVLTENLVQMIGPGQVAHRPWGSDFSPAKKLTVTIFAFERMPDETVRLTATVTIADVASGKKPRTWEVDFHEPAGGTGYADLVAAQSRLIEMLSREIATAVLKTP